MGRGSALAATGEDESSSRLSGGSARTKVFNPDWMMTNVPNGYKTVPGWWWLNEREAIDLLGDPVETFLTDADRLQAIAQAENIPFEWVEAPRILKEAGRSQARAYPVSLLEEFYPAYP